MTQQEAGPPTQPLTSILAQVKVTEGQAIQLLNSLAEANYDKDPTLAATLYDSIAGIQGVFSGSSTKEAEDKEPSKTAQPEEPTHEGPISHRR